MDAKETVRGWLVGCQSMSSLPDGGRHRDLRSRKAGENQQKVPRATLPLMAPCWETLASGEHVVGRWYSWTMMKRWCPCVGCTARWRQNTRFSEPSRGRSWQLSCVSSGKYVREDPMEEFGD